MGIYLTQQQIEEYEARKFGYSVEDWHRWKADHMDLFGHAPEVDLRNLEPCSHPMHLKIARAMNEDRPRYRAEAINPHTLITEDDAEIDPRYGTAEYIERALTDWDDDDIREFKE